MVNETLNRHRFLGVLLLAAAVLTLTAWLRGAEYDEQYSLFLTAGVPRPAWPETVFPAGLARDIQAGTSGFLAIGQDLRVTDVHPPLYFWLLALWRAAFGPDLFVARALSVVLGVAALGLTGAIAQRARIPPAQAMLLTLGCYAFAYTSGIARGFALAQLLLLGGALCLVSPSRAWRFALGGALLGGASFANYLAIFVGAACLAAAGLYWLSGRAWRHPAPLAILGFAVFLPADLWWFMAQRASRDGQFPAFSAIDSLTRLATRGAGAIFGGLPLYLPEPASRPPGIALGLLLLCLVWRVARGWHAIAPPTVRATLALAVVATPAGLFLLGAMFGNTPIEVRYLAFATPFAGLLVAATAGRRLTALVLAIQAAALAGLMLAPQTMQPARAAARAAAELAGDGPMGDGPMGDRLVLLPRGNDGVGVVGAFAIEAPPGLPLLLVAATATPASIEARLSGHRRVVLALLEQDEASRAASAAMRRAFDGPRWREVARRPNLAVYERIGGD